PKLKISMEEFKRIILNQKVPVALCLVAVMGLPDCNKTSILESILRENIKLKETATRNFEEYMTRKKNPDGLSIYELCVLGGKPYDQYSWSFATEQYGAIFSILCGLVRHIALAKSDIKRVEFLSDGHVSQNKLVDHHFKLLMGKAAKQLKDISMDEKKEALFLNGLTLANIMDVGVNKALYDFLPIMLSFCRGHLRLVFFSLERDGPKLDEVPDLSADHYSRRGDNRLALTMRSRLNCILHFATLGHNPKQKEDDSKRTLVVASSNSQSVVAGFSSQLHKAATDKIQEEAEKLNIKKFVSNVALVSINDADSLKKAKEEITKFIMKEQIFQKTLPLKWIFLHSFMVSVQQKEGAMKAIILKKREVYDYAAKELRMDEEDFENFLVTFTDFGSILYMPQFRDLRDIVVVDIWEFVQFLNELIYPKKEKKWYKDLTTYGIIKISDASEILKKHMEIFIKIIITFGMAAFISKEKAFLNGRFLTEVCYYLPSARIDKKSPSGHSNDYAFLKIESPNFPANIQASISHEIMKRQNFYLIGNESFDTSQFGYCTPSGCPIQITMVYGGSQTKLILHINDACTGMHHCVSACKGVIEACCDSLDKISNQIQYLKYSIGIPCSAVDGDSHLFNFKDDSDLCQACIRSIDSTISCHKYWIEAAKMCNKGSKTRMSESTYGLKTKLLEKDAHISKLMKKKSQLLEMITSLKKQLTKETRSVKVQSNYLMRLMDDLECLSDVQVAEKKLFLIQGDKPQLMNWEKYGLRIGVQEGSLLSSETVEAAVVALVGGQFEFPPNTVLVSAVYAVSLSKPLLKRLKLEIQHCIDLTGRPDLAQCLKFAIAPMSTPSLPYLFKLVEGGEFSSKSGYGFIQPKGKEDKELIDENSILDDSGSIASPLVSAVAAFKSMDQTELLDKPASTESHEVHSTGMKEATNYAGLIYYEEKHAEDLVTFIAAKKLDALLQFIEGKHSKAEMGPNVYFRIASPFIELNLNAPQKKSFKGWTIEPHTEPCKLFQRDIFNFGDKDYSLPPSCLISVYSSPDAVPTLHYSVPVEGVADPVTLNIHRSRRTAHLTAVAASGSDEATPAPTKIGREGGIDIKTARQKIKEVMNKNHSNYADILESSLNEIANKLFEAGIITRQVQKSPTYESITSSFLSVMNLLDSKSDLEKHCMKYLEALFSIGGPIEFVANHLREKWTAALEGALQFEHESN
uniref:Uncharacterized protein n=1 Tax=Amphimedon queenslandica TaxID=400682 RepID=A0A1X7UWF7_AMPQE